MPRRSCSVALLVFILVESSTPWVHASRQKHRTFSSLARQGRIADEALQKSSKQQQEQEQQPRGLYIHIPFCRQKCYYCDFAVVPVGKRYNKQSETTTNSNTPSDLENRYKDAILQELQAIGRTLPPRRLCPLQSIYFGGGTPSLARASTIQAILEQVDSIFTTSSSTTEITMEMDPGTFDATYLQHVTAAGVNRVSLGVQAAQDATLQRLGRTHRRADVDDAVALLSRHHVNNVSIDLMTGLPGVSAAEWMETLELAVHEWQPQHLSIYDLQVEPGTAFGRWYRNENSKQQQQQQQQQQHPIAALPSPEESAFLYQFTAGYLKYYGWDHYEVSSYASSPSYRSRHNQLYWDYNSSWFAVGLGATSMVTGQRRRKRPRAMADYLAWVSRGCVETELEGNDDEGENGDDNDNDDDTTTELVLRRLRTADGLDVDRVQNVKLENAIWKGAELALELGLANRVGNILRLADPKGFLFSNTIISTIMAEMDQVQDG